MAPQKTAGPKPEAQAPKPSPLDELAVEESEAPIDIPDARDIVKRQPKQKFSGKIVRAKPTHGGVVVEMRPEDWANCGIEGHPLVRWDFLINKFQVPIEELSEEALAYLLEHDGNRFEVIEPTKE